MPSFEKVFRKKVVLLFCFGTLLLLNFSCSKNELIVTSNEPKRLVASDSNDNFKNKISPNLSLFEQNLPAEINLSDENDEVSKRIVKDYGAIFVAQNNVAALPKIIFKDEEECLAWQSKIPTKRENFGGIEIELQTAAMNDLMAARDEMRGKNLNITARGTWAARRSYKDTEKIWSTRITPGLVF